MLKRYPYKAIDSTPQRFFSHKEQDRIVKELNALDLPVVEVGGPTNRGFSAIGTQRINPGILITNIDPTEGAEMLASVCALPFKTGSLGGILVCGLTTSPEYLARQGTGSMFDPRLMKADGHLFRMMVVAERLNKGREDEDTRYLVDLEAHNFNQRAALIKEARRTLAVGGLLVWNTMSDWECRLAETIGFGVVAEATVPTAINGLLAGERVLQLQDIETCAGIYIDQNDLFSSRVLQV